MHPSDMKGGQTINTTIGQPNHQHHDWPAKPSTPRLASQTINITIGQPNHQLSRPNHPSGWQIP
jgi:hypothetical protein